MLLAHRTDIAEKTYYEMQDINDEDAITKVAGLLVSCGACRLPCGFGAAPRPSAAVAAANKRELRQGAAGGKVAQLWVEWRGAPASAAPTGQLLHEKLERITRPIRHARTPRRRRSIRSRRMMSRPKMKCAHRPAHLLPVVVSATFAVCEFPFGVVSPGRSFGSSLPAGCAAMCSDGAQRGSLSHLQRPAANLLPRGRWRRTGECHRPHRFEEAKPPTGAACRGPALKPNCMERRSSPGDPRRRAQTHTGN
eukprot:GHVT01002158.1.p2 GENE.GHVT01002158.1~~GHVT01002158.1.p2  ORF type:complete len:251 (-),score=35.95 GHVT01002158.1:906-1658(-)